MYYNVALIIMNMILHFTFNWTKLRHSIVILIQTVFSDVLIFLNPGKPKGFVFTGGGMIHEITLRLGDWW
jgi:hypothetical protein